MWFFSEAASGFFWSVECFVPLVDDSVSRMFEAHQNMVLDAIPWWMKFYVVSMGILETVMAISMVVIAFGFLRVAQRWVHCREIDVR